MLLTQPTGLLHYENNNNHFHFLTELLIITCRLSGTKYIMQLRMTFTVQDFMRSAGHKNFQITATFPRSRTAAACRYVSLCYTGNISCLSVQGLVSNILYYLHKWWQNLFPFFRLSRPI